MYSASLLQVAELKGASASGEQQSQAAAQRAKHEQQHLHEQNARLTAELAAVTEDRYELQVNFASGTSACKPYHTPWLIVKPRCNDTYPDMLR
jgi:hypothetical protein